MPDGSWWYPVSITTGEPCSVKMRSGDGSEVEYALKEKDCEALYGNEYKLSPDKMMRIYKPEIFIPHPYGNDR